MNLGLDRIVMLLDSAPDSVQIMQQLIGPRISRTTELVTAALATFTDQERVGSALELYGDLDKRHQARFLMSAELGELLNEIPGHGEHSNPVILDGIFDAIAREHGIFLFNQGRHSPLLHRTTDRTLYSPLGDISLRRNQDGDWNLHPGYLVDDLIALDFDSPVALKHEPDSGTLAREPLPHTEDEKRLVVEKFTLALQNIDRSAPTHGQIIRNFVRRIIVRKTIESTVMYDAAHIEDAPFGSEHRPIHPNSLRCINIHHPQKSIGACMESLFHETIHNVLASWESVHGHFAPSERDVRPISPWTGNPIPNHSLAHAVFVWYGLHRLFTGALQNQEALADLGRAEILQRLGQFEVGFLSGRPLVSHFAHLRQVHPGLAAAIQQMQENIQRQSAVFQEVA